MGVVGWAEAGNVGGGRGKGGEVAFWMGDIPEWKDVEKFEEEKGWLRFIIWRMLMD